MIGGGGREHAIVWKIAASPLVDKIYCAPGNAGIMQAAECVDLPIMDNQKLLKFARKARIDLTIVGPEAPLVNGIVDAFEENGMICFGPSRRAAELEGSKAFCKYFLSKYDIPTADYRVFDDYEQAKAFLLKQHGQIVVKADGLAAGKGVFVCKDRDESLLALDKIMREKEFGAAGARVVIEECLTGDEVSVMALSDGENYVTLMPSQDHKRIFDNDQGPNTGGMGAYAPTPHISPAMMRQIEDDIIAPTIKGMALEDRPYKGVLYAGLMITADGPKVVEYNVRFGDPEAQVVLPMTESDLLAAILATHDGSLKRLKWRNRDGGAVCVVLASGGYPGAFEKSKKIHGLDHQWDDGVLVFHAGTSHQGRDIVTNGGRVLGVTALDISISKAIDKVYKAIKWIAFDGAYYRKDIALRALR
ncbi:phosphoribosylamine--glycine ligase [candidate division KSB1 bacterium]|nr:phosphoribosylamine--glycine ligase [candidate division KSB1 bacterium]RQW07262.1 MAG: phosphoribosylamine--glycine ligase [candidate division KSB1 bacterium]